MTILRDLSTIFASCFSLVLFMFLFKPRYSTKKTVILTVSLMIPLMLVNFVLLFILGPEKMGTMLLPTCSLPSLIFFWFMSKYRDGRFFFAFCFADTLVLEIIHATSIIDFYLGNTFIFTFAARLTLCPLLALYVFKCVRPIFMPVQEQVKKGWYTFAAISLIFYVVLSMSMTYPEIITNRPEYLPTFILLLILMPMLYLNIFTTLRRQQQLHEMAQQDAILKLQVANITARVEEFSAADEKSRMERHNFRHKLLTIGSLAEKKQYDELQKLVAEYTDAIDEPQVRRYCSSPVIDAVLASYLPRAESKGIRVTTGISCPDRIPVSEAELATVFANAIENAINACDKVPQGERFIKIQVLTVPRLMIQISNSYNGRVVLDKKGLPVSREEGHGFGTRSIVAFCEKNGALYEFKADNRVFALRLVFG